MTCRHHIPWRLSEKDSDSVLRSIVRDNDGTEEVVLEVLISNEKDKKYVNLLIECVNAFDGRDPKKLYRLIFTAQEAARTLESGRTWLHQDAIQLRGALNEFEKWLK